MEKIVLRIVELEKVVYVDKIIEISNIKDQLQNSSARKDTHHNSEMRFSGVSPNRLDDSSIEDIKTVGAFSELQHIEETLQRHQEDLNKRYE